MHKILRVFYLIVIIHTCLVIRPVLAQNLPSNLSNTHINELSDNQIRELIQDASSSGLSDSELLQMAAGRGLPPGEVKNLQSRINSIRGNTNGSRKIDYDTTSTSRSLNRNYNDSSPDSANKKVFNSIVPKVFGSEIFKNSNSSFTPNLNLATPKNYIVGPGDQLNVNVYGNSVANWKLEVSPEGNINIPEAGILNVAGKTIDQVTNDIKNKLTAYHFSIGKGTSVQVSLGNIRSIKVIIIGNVKKPGTYTVPSLATAFNALYAAGGPNDRGSYRQIEIIRNNKIIRTLDIYDFLTKGDQQNNIGLQDQDIIRVPAYRTHVTMLGEVNNPAIFEVLPGETLADVLRFANGFTDQAYTSRIKIYQISNQQRRITDITESEFKNYHPLRGDKYIVEPILERFENRVVIAGAVFRPGDFQLEDGLTLSQLIKKAAGLTEDAFTNRGSITRLNPDNTKQLLSFNVKGIVNKTIPDILLQREDSVYISSIFELKDRDSVTIKGEVRKPGNFAYADSMKVADLVIKAGGFNLGASPKRLEVARRKTGDDSILVSNQAAVIYTVNLDKNLSLTNVDFTLQPYDIVTVYNLPNYEKQRTVKVEGEVLYPGYYIINTQNEKISDLIKRAGNLKPVADAEGSSLRRTNLAILGVDKSKRDSTVLINEHSDRLKHLQYAVKDTINRQDNQPRNNFIGIDLTQILQKPGSVTDLILEDGDVIRVPKKQQVVRVNGLILYPSAIVYRKDKSFKDYISNAGGFSPLALKRAAYIVYANGEVRSARKFLFFNSYPEVKPGSEIFVPQKLPRRANSTQELIGLTTGIASIGAIILGIISLHK